MKKLSPGEFQEDLMEQDPLALSDLPVQNQLESHCEVDKLRGMVCAFHFYL